MPLNLCGCISMLLIANYFGDAADLNLLVVYVDNELTKYEYLFYGQTYFPKLLIGVFLTSSLQKQGLLHRVIYAPYSSCSYNFSLL